MLTVMAVRPTYSASQQFLYWLAANGFFVAAEFSLVAVRRSRVAQLVATGRSLQFGRARAFPSRDQARRPDERLAMALFVAQ
jgi:CBS domain containing-hemolysin-like protein